MQPDKTEVVKLSKQLLGLKFMKASGPQEESKREEKKITRPCFGDDALQILDLLQDQSSLSLARLKMNQGMSRKQYGESAQKTKLGQRKKVGGEPKIKKREKREI